MTTPIIGATIIFNEKKINHTSILEIITSKPNLKMTIKKSFTKYLRKVDKTKDVVVVDPKDQSKAPINCLPYDILSMILGLVHANQVITRPFITISLVCRQWRTLSRINGQTFDVNSFFARNDTLKMKGEALERCLGYIAYLYPSVEHMSMARLSTDSATNLKYSILYLDKIERLTRIDLDLAKVDVRDFSVLVGALRAKRSLKHVAIQNSTSEHVFQVVELLEHARSINTLELSNAWIENRDDALRLHDYLIDNTSLTSLSITFARDSGQVIVETFKEVLAANPNMQELHLQCLALGTVGVKTFSRFTYPHAIQRLTKLSFPNCGLIDKDFEELANIFSTNTSITSINLSYNPLVQPIAINLLLTSLANNLKSPITKLELAGLQISDESLCTLANVTTKLNLYLLDISGPVVTTPWDIGFQTLVSSIAKSPLVWLALNRATLSNRAFSSFSDMIKSSHSCLSHLEMSGTLNQQTGNLIGYSLASNTTLTSLNISSCDLVQQGCGSIALSLQTNKTLVSLNLSNTKLHNVIIMLLAEGMKKNTTLVHLDLSNNILATESLSQLFSSLHSHPTLSRLILENTGIGSKDCSGLSLLLESNNQLSVDISCNNISSSKFNNLLKALSNSSDDLMSNQNNQNNNNFSSCSTFPLSSNNNNISNMSRNLKFNDCVYH